MSPRNLDDYARQGYSRVPIVREVLADLDTPLSAYRKLAAGPYSYLFESVQGGERWGRYSIIGLPAREVVRITGPRITVSDADGAVVEELDSDDPIAWIEDYRLQYRAPDVPGLPGGLFRLRQRALFRAPAGPGAWRGRAAGAGHPADALRGSGGVR